MSLIRLLAAGSLALAAAVGVHAAALVGQPAPDFTLSDGDGASRSLSQFRGRTVVLEWNNPGCPFVQKHYSSGNIPRQQAAATADGVVWLTINSGAPGKQGHLDGAGARAFLAQYHASPTAYLLDPDGTAGHAYGARTTPHLYVVDGAGVLRYMGGIDSIPSADKSDLAKAIQYVPQALAELKAGKPVSVPTAQPYGCSVKYAD